MSPPENAHRPGPTRAEQLRDIIASLQKQYGDRPEYLCVLLTPYVRRLREEEARERRKKAGHIPRHLRRLILKRDEVCECGDLSTEIDHILPVAMGGKSEPKNLRGVCARCNRAAGDKMLPTYPCPECGRLTRAKGSECPDCQKDRRARARREAGARIRKKASEWKRLKARAERQAWRRARA